MSAPQPVELLYAQNKVRVYSGRWQDVPWNKHIGPDHHAGLIIVTDPPYGTGGWRRTEKGAGSNPAGKLIVEQWDDGALDWMDGVWAHAAMRPKAIVTFWPSSHTYELLHAARQLHYDKTRQLYMRKLDPKPGMSDRTRWSVEPIWVLSDEGFQLYGDSEDLITASTPRAGRDTGASGHPYEKPLRVMLWLLEKLSSTIFTHDLVVVDPFGGSGTTAEACLRLRLPVVTCEQDPGWAEHIKRRVETAALQRSLADATESEVEIHDQRGLPGL